MCLTVSIEEFCTAVCMIMSLKNYIDIIFVEYRSKLCSQDHAVCIGVIKAGTIDILMNRNDTPFCIRISGNRFFDGFGMFRYVVIICIQYDEKSVAVRVVIIAAGCRFAVICGVGIIEMVGIVRIQRIMISDSGGNRKARKSVCT